MFNHRQYGSTKTGRSLAWKAAGALLLLPLGAAGLTYLPAFAAESAMVVPAPQIDEPAGAAASETAILAGGCFWGVQGVFQHVKGVSQAVSGYAGGTADTAHYETVGGGDTGHAESVKVTFDPHQISYGRILQIYFSVAHDPTELNRQGPDSGTQYRSAIFPENDAQKRIAQSYIEQLDKAHVFSRPIVTKTDAAPAGFFPAEAYHQDYLTLHPRAPYIAINDIPKVENLQRLFPDQYRKTPVTVAAIGTN